MVVAQESLCSGLADTAQCGTGLWTAQIKGGVITGARRHGVCWDIFGGRRGLCGAVGGRRERLGDVPQI